MAVADVFKALGDPTRREILRMLAARGDLSAGEIAAAFAMSKPSISHHLTVLRHAALVRDRRSGQQVIYALDTSVLQDVLAWLWAVAERGETSGQREARTDG